MYMNGTRFIETDFRNEEALEKTIIEQANTFFGEKAIYFDVKNKVDSKSLGAAIPDGFLFDFKDADNPEFYLVEVELSKHDFYNHIFPQVTKFFAFFKNPASRNNLIEKLHTFIKSNSQLEDKFRAQLGKKEIYKALKDIVEGSQNILLIIDKEKPELPEVLETYTDTWDKMVTVEILKMFSKDGRSIFTLTPDFESIEDLGVEEVSGKPTPGKYTESFHTEGVDADVISAYSAIKAAMTTLDPEIEINPQKWYISLRKNRNFAFMKFRKKKMHIVIMFPYDKATNLIGRHKLLQLSEARQNFYNGPCFQVTLENANNIDEVEKVLEEAYRQQMR